MEQVHGVFLSGHSLGPGWNEAIERYAASVFRYSHDILHRHRAPCVATRAKDAAPADEATRGRGDVGAAGAASPSGLKIRCSASRRWRVRSSARWYDGLGFPTPFDHTGLPQRAELLRERRLANAELLLDFAHRVLALAKEASNQEPLRVAEKLE